jgi:hypothetical protein
MTQVMAEPAGAGQGCGHDGGVAMTMQDELERLDEPEDLPQEIVQWQPTRGHLVDVRTPRATFGAVAVGALAFGALALGAVAIGRLMVGSVGIGRARVRRLEIDKLIVHHVVAPD